MKQRYQFLLLVWLLFFSCSQHPKNASVLRWKAEIKEAELNFAKMAREESIFKAFTTFADKDAVLNRNNTLISGREAISDHYNKPEFINGEVKLTWEPDFIDVAYSGDLGYTYGHYVYSYRDSLGNTVESHGIFHTIWKKQTDGSWRYVWD
jgi:ketosteroid isomerase-like protein